MTADTFPDHFVRGLRRQDHVTAEGVSLLAFVPDRRTARDRADNGQEASVNWEDDDTVVDFTLDERDEQGLPKYIYGVARLETKWIDDVNGYPGTRDMLARERAPLPGNPYHGNIVFRGNAEAIVIKMVAANLASRAHIIRRRP